MTVDRQHLAAWLETQPKPITGASYDAVAHVARDAFDPQASLIEFESTLRALGYTIEHCRKRIDAPGQLFVLAVPERRIVARA